MEQEFARTVVRVTPEDSAVGMQQKTARPKLSSGRARGMACTGSAMRGVTASTTTRPYSAAPQLLAALSASPRRKFSPCAGAGNIAESQDIR